MSKKLDALTYEINELDELLKKDTSGSKDKEAVDDIVKKKKQKLQDAKASEKEQKEKLAEIISQLKTTREALRAAKGAQSNDAQNGK